MPQITMPWAFNVFQINQNISQDEIKQQYKKLAMKYHPDRNNGDIQFDEKMKEINAAYTLLKNHVPGAQYKTRSKAYTATGDESYSTFTNFDEYIDSVRNDPGLYIALYEKELSVQPKYKKLDPPFPKQIQSVFNNQFYSHQVDIINHVRAGKDVLIITPTSSGKSVGYMLPFFESVLNNPKTTGIFIFPMKALSNDQLKSFKQYNIGTVERYDGSVTAADKKRIRRNPPNAIFTNPDTIHYSLLRTVFEWAEFLSNLKYIVLDEIHTYKGYFGSNTSNIIYRLLKCAEICGSHPQIICTSATIKDGVEFAVTLAWRDFECVSESGSGVPDKHYLLLYGKSKAPFEVAIEQACRLAEAGKKVIVFCGSRLNVDTLAILTEIYIDDNPYIQLKPSQISGYHAGYDDGDRRRIEQQLKDGDLRILYTTSALELGIDIGSLDVCILYGLPNSNNEIWQRIGRVGRNYKNPALALVVKTMSEIDHYYFTNPEMFMATRNAPESPVINPLNEEIHKYHREFQGFESCLRHADQDDELLDLIFNPRRHSTKYMQFPIRNSWGFEYDLVDQRTKETIGDIEYERIFQDLHYGAVFRYKEKYYSKHKINHDSRKIYLNEIHNPEYITNPNIETVVNVTNIVEERVYDICSKKLLIGFGNIEAIQELGSYKKRRLSNLNESWVNPLKHAGRRTLKTTAVWVSFQNVDNRNAWNTVIDNFKKNAVGVLHSLEHLLVRSFINKGYCDWTDFYGVTIPNHPLFKYNPVAFFYDNCIMGMGIAEVFHDQIFKLIDNSYQIVSTCPCENGCPVCLLKKSYCNLYNASLDKKHITEFLKAIGSCKHRLSKPAKNRTLIRPQFSPVKHDEYKVGQIFNKDYKVIKTTPIEIVVLDSNGDVEYIPVINDEN